MHGNKPSRKKVPFAINDQLQQYLGKIWSGDKSAIAVR